VVRPALRLLVYGRGLLAGSYLRVLTAEFSVWSDNSLTHEEKKRSLELFIEHVVPAFQEQPAAVAR
jgi:hypothetical protein